MATWTRAKEKKELAKLRRDVDKQLSRLQNVGILVQDIVNDVQIAVEELDGFFGTIMQKGETQ